MKKRKPKTANVPLAMVESLLVSVMITLLGTAVLTFLVAGQRIPLNSVGNGIVVVLLLAAIAGAWVAVRMTGQKPLWMGLLSGGIYLLSLLCCTAVFFDGMYQGIGVTALVVLAGSLCVVLASLRHGTGRRKKKYRVR